ncbi:spirocyclase AveC family protein [Mycobacterium sp. 236(2023)]|uniref:spirocyclase AveC family protein n=1 Tax=Mycobacterium sp. 236(2023) TaxID=3038163 RepID=UPI0024151A74|nr:spirocyclase AveC family protein [Mycobacterium sp. 236(2023)]MDG4668173.1 spirocyclase AveC family protein [Mycobacterium sp. 236(2023)]
MTTTKPPVSAGTLLTLNSSAHTQQPMTRPNATALVVTVVILTTLFGWMLSFATREPGARIARPGVDDQTLMSAEPLFGWTTWPYIFEVGAVVMFVGGLIVLVLQSIKAGRITIGLLFFIAGNSLVWLDPWGNWGPYATYDSRLLHWPETWWWASVSPTVEPVFNFIGYYAFYIGPSALSILLLKRVIGPRFSSGAFIHRHPLISLTIITVIVGFIIDAVIETFFVRTGLYGYSQVPKFGSIFVGEAHQFPLLLESLSTTLPFIAVSLLWWRNDTGLTGAERFANKFAITRKTGRAGVLAVMILFMNIGYFAYLAPFFVIRYFDLSTEVARPWRWCAVMVYDPQGHYEKAGEQGPFFEGIWAHWPSGQPNGREVSPPVGEPLPNACRPS